HVQGLACAIHGDDDGQADCSFGRGHDHYEEDKNLAAQRMPVRGKSHERKIHAIEHELDGHEDGDDVALDQRPGHAAGKQDAAEDQVVGKGDHQPSLFCCSMDSGRAARTTAPIRAISTRTEVTSNGNRKSWNSRLAISRGGPGRAPADTSWVPECVMRTHATRRLPASMPGIPNRMATRLPPVLASSPALSSMMTKTNSTMMAPAYTMTCTAATNSAPSRRYSTAREAITATNDNALLIGCRCTSRFTAPATQTAPKIKNRTRCSIESHDNFVLHRSQNL